MSSTQLWTEESLFDVAENYFHGLVNAIHHANTTIELTTYIFKLDEVGNRVAEALVIAAKRGVTVRVSLDGIGSIDDVQEICTLLEPAGIQVKVFHPVPWHVPFKLPSYKTGNIFSKFTFFISKMNRRDHRKFCVIDGIEAWSGNLNVCADHLGRNTYWRDYGVKLTGPAVINITSNFNAVWQKKNTRQSINSEICCCNHSRRTRRNRNRQLVNRIENAQSRIWICSAYFSPTVKIFNAIITAVKRGVEVKIVVAGISDISLFPLLSATYYSELLNHGVQVYSYQKGVLHAKAMLVDNRCVLGSTNLNHRSFYHDLELDVILSKPESIKFMEEAINRDQEDSIRVQSEDVSIFKSSTWLGWLLRLLRYWM